MAKKKSFWPYGILISILLIVLASIATIIVALDNPVEMDTYYLEKYQTVDRDINKIQKKQKEFDKNFKVSLLKDSVKMGKDRVELSLKDKNGNGIDGANIDVLITRPDSSKYDKRYKIKSQKEGKIIIDDFEFSKPGRWQILMRVKVDSYEGFVKYEVFAS